MSTPDAYRVAREAGLSGVRFDDYGAIHRIARRHGVTGASCMQFLARVSSLLLWGMS